MYQLSQIIINVNDIAHTDVRSYQARKLQCYRILYQHVWKCGNHCHEMSMLWMNCYCCENNYHQLDRWIHHSPANLWRMCVMADVLTVKSTANRHAHFFCFFFYPEWQAWYFCFFFFVTVVFSIQNTTDGVLGYLRRFVDRRLDDSRTRMKNGGCSLNMCS